MKNHDALDGLNVSAVLRPNVEIFCDTHDHEPPPGVKFIHLWGDPELMGYKEEYLHLVAEALGLSRADFQSSEPGFPHYLLPAGRRKEALEAGAHNCSLVEWRRCQAEEAAAWARYQRQRRRGLA